MKKNKGSCFIKMYPFSLKQNPEYSKGFTLIELLIVIFLMGLLSFIVLASLDKAREMGLEPSIRSQFSALRAQAERYYSKYNRYGGIDELNTNGLCYDSLSNFGFGAQYGLLKDLADSLGVSYIELGNETEGKLNVVTCHSVTTTDSDSWAVEVPYKDSLMYCVDSTGVMIIQEKHLDRDGDAFCL